MVGLGRAWYEWNNLEASANYVQNGLETGKKAGIMDILLRGYLVLARVRQAQGDLEGALDALENAESAARHIETAEIKELGQCTPGSSMVGAWRDRGGDWLGFLVTKAKYRIGFTHPLRLLARKYAGSGTT